MSEAAELSHTLDLARIALSDQRLQVAQESIVRLTIKYVELLPRWGYRASPPPARCRLATTVGPDSSNLITYVDVPWACEPELTARQVYRLGLLILVAHLARNHLGRSLLGAATRDQRIASLAEAREIAEEASVNYFRPPARKCENSREWWLSSRRRRFRCVGKRSVTQALALRASDQEHSIVKFIASRYETPAGYAITRYLQSPPPDSSPMATPMLFTADRLIVREEMIDILEAGVLVLVDRCASSNVAYQAGPVASEEREYFAAWIEQLEYGLINLSRSNFTACLNTALGGPSSRTESRALDSDEAVDGCTEIDVDLLAAGKVQHRNLLHDADWASADVSRMAPESVIDYCWDELSSRIMQP